MQNMEKNQTELVEVQRKLEGLHLLVSSLSSAENGAEKVPDGNSNLPFSEKQDSSAAAKQPSMLEFISLLFEFCPDLLDHNSILNLRLVSKETKACIEKMAPLTSFKLDIANLPALLRLEDMPERLESLQLILSEDDLCAEDTKYLSSLFRPLPKLATLKIPRMYDLGTYLCESGPPCWPALSYLELHEDWSPAATLHIISRAPLTALKKLRYSSPEPVTPEILSTALSSLNELTYLGLTCVITRNNCDIFKNNALPKLQVADLLIRTEEEDTSSEEDHAPAAAATTMPALSWPKLQKLVIKHPEIYMANSLNGAVILKELQSMCMTFCQTSIPVPALLNDMHGGALEHLTLDEWSPSLCSFEGVHLPQLKNLTLSCLRSDACYGDLLKASLPALEDLTIIEDRKLENAQVTIDVDAIQGPPFPSLRNFYFVRKVNLDPRVSNGISGTVAVAELMNPIDYGHEFSDAEAAAMGMYRRFVWPYLRVLYTRIPGLPACIINVLVLIAALGPMLAAAEEQEEEEEEESSEEEEWETAED
jgi:hypothetical protein